MDPSHDSLSKAKLDEAQVARVMQRAAELDATHGSRVSVEDIRQIARELGISKESVDLAVDEALHGAAPAPVAPPADATPAAAGPVRGWLRKAQGAVRTAVVTVSGFLLGWIGVAAHPALGGRFGVVGPVSLGLTVLLGISTLRQHRRERTLLHFELDNLLLWGAFTQGIVVAHGQFMDHVTAVPFLFWLGYAGIGGYLVLRGERPKAAETAEAGAPLIAGSRG